MIAPRIALLASVVFFAVGCGMTGGSSSAGGSSSGSIPSSSSGATSSGSSTGITQARSSLSRDTAPAVGAGDLAALVAANNAFALDLHRRVIEPGANVMTSPFSVSTALAMTSAGARGVTASQLASALHFTLPQAQLHPAFDALDLALHAPPSSCSVTPDPFRLNVVNTAWGQAGYPFVPAYLDTLAVSYGAEVPLVDFRNDAEGARQAINDAVARATADKIKDLLPPQSVDALTRLVLTNAVYFKGRWASEFDRARTAPGAFRLLAGGAADVPFMHGVILARAAAQPAYDAVELRYLCSDFVMTLIAPKAGSFEVFEGALDVAGLTSVDAAMAPSKVTLSMPKFSFRTTRRLRAPLEALGLTEAFLPGSADFRGIADVKDEPLFISDVAHQAFVAVDEEGTEAAAATAVIFAGGSAPPPPPPEITVNVDRPFLFLVRHKKTGQILFLGRVVDPR
jgi:serpin B